MKSVVIITGASRGIGLATAEHFKTHAWQVVNIARKPCTVNGAINLAIDLSQVGWQQQYRQELLNTVSGADRICIVHNAGVLFKDNVVDLPEEQLRTTLEVNVIAPALLNQIFLPLMREHSSIIYVGSTLSDQAAPNTTSYVVSKHAILGLMRSTCQDLYGTGITTACVCPGFTDTEMMRQHVGNDPEILKVIAAKASAKRMVKASEIAETIYFCATHPVVNGSLLHANLGQRQ